MTNEQMISIVRARQALFAAAEDAAREEDEEARIEMQRLAHSLVALERRYPEAQAAAFSALAGPRHEWEIA